MGAGELGELGPRGEGIGNSEIVEWEGEISVSESLGGWEQGNWGTGTERRGNWEGNGNNEIVGRFLLVNREQ
jgi:hypothetical protein